MFSVLLLVAAYYAALQALRMHVGTPGAGKRFFMGVTAAVAALLLVGAVTPGHCAERKPGNKIGMIAPDDASHDR